MTNPQRYPNGARRYPAQPARFAAAPLTDAEQATVADELIVDPGTAAGFLAGVRKAVAGGIVGAVTGGAGSTFAAAIADLTITSSEGWSIAGAILAGFALGFAGVWAAPANAPSSRP